MAETLPKGIRRRGDSLLIDVTWEGKRLTATCGDLDGAIRKRTELLNRLQNPDPGEIKLEELKSRAWTLGEAYDRTLALRWAGTKGEETVVINGTAACDHFGRSRPLNAIDTEALDSYVEALKARGNSDATINRKLAALSTIMTTAIERKGMTAKPKMPRRKEFKGRIRFLSDAEERVCLQLLAQWDKLDECDAFTVLIDTGFRVGELQRMHERDINPAQRSVSCWENKGDLPRTVPLTSRAWDVVSRRLVTHAPSHKGKLFDYGDHWLRTTWDRMKSSMGLVEDTQFVPHTLRHTFASRLVQRGVSLIHVQRLLGHKDIKMTMRYAHLAPADLRLAIDALERTKVAA